MAEKKTGNKKGSTKRKTMAHQTNVRSNKGVGPKLSDSKPVLTVQGKPRVKMDWQRIAQDGRRLNRIRFLVRKGLTHEQIAEKLGTTLVYFQNAIRNYPSIRAAVEDELDDLRYDVENVLLRMALDGDLKAIELWLKGSYQSKYVETKKSRAEVGRLNAITQSVLQDVEKKKREIAIMDKVAADESVSSNNLIDVLKAVADKTGDL